jgi:hypothetical protein
VSFSSICQAIIGELNTDLGGQGYTFEHGWVDDAASAASERANRGFVYGIAKRENSDNVNEEQIEIGIRVFPNFQQRRGHPRDATTFEDVAETLQTSLKDKQTTLPQAAGAWFLRVTELDIDHERQMVEARVIVWQFSTFVG